MVALFRETTGTAASDAFAPRRTALVVVTASTMVAMEKRLTTSTNNNPGKRIMVAKLEPVVVYGRVWMTPIQWSL
jgi:hypothetical protein